MVENLGYERTPYMILYHINGGFPVVDEGSQLLSPTLKVTPRDAEAEADVEECYRFQVPTPGFKEKVYYHEMASEGDGTVYAALVNKTFNRLHRCPRFLSLPLSSPLPEHPHKFTCLPSSSFRYCSNSPVICYLLTGKIFQYGTIKDIDKFIYLSLIVIIFGRLKTGSLSYFLFNEAQTSLEPLTGNKLQFEAKQVMNFKLNDSVGRLVSGD